jgi:uncharacterized protein (TIGR02217 family)
MATTSAFVEARFPTAIAYGSQGGPEFLTSILVLGSGYEQRVINWERARARYNCCFGVRTPTHLAELINFFRSVRGRAIGFRFKDHADYLAVNAAYPAYATMPLVVGDGDTDTVQLTKTYDLGSGVSYVRPIYKPVSGTVHVFIEDEEVAGWTVDTTTGLVTFAEAPAEGVVVSWTGEFDVPCRFDVDHLPTSFDQFRIGSAPEITIVEIRL